MPDLSAYIDFNVVLDKSGGSPIVKFVDPDHYPAGVDITLTGIFSITQPDGITLTGNFTSPDVFWTGTALSQPTKALRLNLASGFQNGSYTVTYTARATGYTQTVLTKVFTLTYTAPTLVITPGFDEFKPQITVTDATTYTQTGFTNTGTVRTWTATIRSVLGTNQNIAGAGTVFDMNYGGNYYDSYYDVTLTAVITYQLTAANSYVTTVDKLILSGTYQAQIPPTLVQLLASLTALKAQVDAAILNCNNYVALQETYQLAEVIYSHLIFRGRLSDFAGLADWVWQLQKIFNNNTIPAYTNTNGVIPVYDWGVGNPTWTSISGKPVTTRFAWLVGTGGFPLAGATTLVDPALVGFNVRMWRGGLAQQPSNPGTGNTYFTKLINSNTVTFPALVAGEEIIIETIPL